jgi:D-alanine transaminase
MPLAFWNGELMPLDEVRVSVLDRAYLFGDAAYEVLRVYHKRPWLMEEHLKRMERSLKELAIDASLAPVRAEIETLIEKADFTHGSVYLQISRGAALRTHVPPSGLTPNRLVYLQEMDERFGEEKRQNGVRALSHPDIRWHRADIKSANLLGNVLAAMEARAKGFDEAIFYDRERRITEGTHTTFFGVRKGELVTTPLSNDILPGITREFVFGLAKAAGIPCSEGYVSLDELETLGEAFFSGTVSEIQPIVEIDGTTIGLGKPGPISRKIGELYAAAIARGA